MSLANPQGVHLDIVFLIVFRPDGGGAGLEMVDEHAGEGGVL